MENCPEFLECHTDTFEMYGIAPPEGGETCAVRITVDMSVPWDEALKSAGGYAPSYYWGVGDYYPAVKDATPQVCELFLVKFDPNSKTTGTKALEWAAQNCLDQSNPRHVFALSAKLAEIRAKLGLDYMSLISTTPCIDDEGKISSHKVPGKDSCLSNFNCLSNHDWFVFVRKQPLVDYGTVLTTSAWSAARTAKILGFLDASPSVPKLYGGCYWRVKKHMKSRVVEIDPAQIELWLSAEQSSKFGLDGHNLLGRVEGYAKNRKTVILNANMLDFLIENTNLIPDSWKGKLVFFFGTIYVNEYHELHVRHLCWVDNRWRWGNCSLDRFFGSNDPVALLEKNHT